jgi:hypothetical protein
MRQLWGPLGWMTLHSISLNYPETPSLEDKAILKQYLDAFAECISCPTCKSHFLGIYKTYTQQNVNWSSSRQELFLFIVRAHNSVNRRIDKPVLQTVSDCLETIKLNSKNTTLYEFRQKYIQYLTRNWSVYQDGEGFMAMHNVKIMQRINNEFWNLREIDISQVKLEEAEITRSIEDRRPIPRISANIPTFNRGSLPSVGFRIKGGTLQLGNK